MKMKLVVITAPVFFSGEPEIITMLFNDGLEYLHLRKPGAPQDAEEKLLERIPPEFHDRIVIHENFCLYERQGLKGIHLNSRNPHIPEGYAGHASRSCHSLDEVAACRNQYDYVFLSPVFDSISKKGYNSAFRPEELLHARQSGGIGDNVIALGGISSANIGLVRKLGFGGAAVLGDIWNRKADEIAEHFNELKRLIQTF